MAQMVNSYSVMRESDTNENKMGYELDVVKAWRWAREDLLF